MRSGFATAVPHAGEAHPAPVREAIRRLAADWPEADDFDVTPAEIDDDQWVVAYARGRTLDVRVVRADVPAQRS